MGRGSGPTGFGMRGGDEEREKREEKEIERDRGQKKRENTQKEERQGALFLTLLFSSGVSSMYASEIAINHLVPMSEWELSRE
jgi:hypothetical protein